MSSTGVMTKIRGALAYTFSATGVRRDKQAIVVEFRQKQFSVDIVPALFRGMSDLRRPLYDIPDGSGGWMPTSPDTHGLYIGGANAQAGGQLEPIARLIKFWTACRSHVQLSGFHAEMVLADSGTCVGVQSHAVCLATALGVLASRAGAGLNDPCGISGTIHAVNTRSQRLAAANALSGSADHARKAVAAEQQGRFDEAYRQWDIVFNGSFPKR